MTKAAIRLCPVCGNGIVEILHTQKFVLPEGHPLADGYDVVGCEKCGFAYADTDTPQDAYDRFYAKSSKYGDSKTATGGGESTWDAERLHDTAAVISEFLHTHEADILDIGCANGGLLAALARRGFTNLAGLDPASACTTNTEARGFTAHVGSLHAVPANLGQFDVVILSHVLEHIQDLRGALTNLRHILRPAAFVYIEVPDATGYGDFLSAPFQDFNTEHINHFSGICLDNLVQQFGLEPALRCTPKVIKSSQDTLYPALYSIYRYTGEVRTGWAKDSTLREYIHRYIADSDDLMVSLNAHLYRSLEDCAEVILWGSGQLAMKLLSQEPLRTAKIVACVDSNPINQGRKLNGVPILAPTELNGLDCPIVIATTLHDSAIRSDICKLGIPNRLISLKKPGNSQGACA